MYNEQNNIFYGGSVVIYLYHYFERKVGPFVSLSDLQVEDASDKPIVNFYGGNSAIGRIGDH